MSFGPAVNDLYKSKEISWIELGISGNNFALHHGQAFLREGIGRMRGAIVGWIQLLRCSLMRLGSDLGGVNWGRCGRDAS